MAFVISLLLCYNQSDTLKEDLSKWASILEQMDLEEKQG